MNYTNEQLTIILLSEMLVKSTSIETNDDIVELTSDIAERIVKSFAIPVVMPSLLHFKERRDKLKLTLRQVAKETNISAATISRIERGEECFYNNVKALNDWYTSNGA